MLSLELSWQPTVVTYMFTAQYIVLNIITEIAVSYLVGDSTTISQSADWCRVSACGRGFSENT
jgi:hypothetical protein